MSNVRDNANTFDLPPDDFLRATTENPEAVVSYLKYLERENARLSQSLRDISVVLKSTQTDADQAAFTVALRPRVLVKYAEIAINLQGVTSNHGFASKPTSLSQDDATRKDPEHNFGSCALALQKDGLLKSGGKELSALNEFVSSANSSPSPARTKIPFSFSFRSNKKHPPPATVKIPNGFPTIVMFKSNEELQMNTVRTPTPPQDFSQAIQPDAHYNRTDAACPAVVLPPSIPSHIAGISWDNVDKDSIPTTTLPNNLYDNKLVSEVGVLKHVESEQVVHLQGHQYASQPLYTISELTEDEEATHPGSGLSCFRDTFLEAPNTTLASSNDHPQDEITETVTKDGFALTTSCAALNGERPGVPSVVINIIGAISNTEGDSAPIPTASTLADNFDDWFNTLQSGRDRTRKPRMEPVNVNPLSEAELLEESNPDLSSDSKIFRPADSKDGIALGQVSVPEIVSTLERVLQPSVLKLPEVAPELTVGASKDWPALESDSKTTLVRYSIKELFNIAQVAPSFDYDYSQHEGIKQMNEWTSKWNSENIMIEKMNEVQAVSSYKGQRVVEREPKETESGFAKYLAPGRRAFLSESQMVVEQATNKLEFADGKENVALSS